MLRTVPGFIESAYWGYNDQLPQPIETVAKFKVYLFADRQQWERFTRSFTGEQASVFCKIKTGAYYLNGACVVYNIGRQRTLSAIGHEGWHQFNSRHFTFRLPSWLDEGVAMLFEAHTAGNGTFYFEPSGNSFRLKALSKTLSKGNMMPPEELIATHPGDVLATDQTEAAMAFYSQSYALVRFLREGRFGPHVGIYEKLLADGLEGDWPLDEVSKIIAADRDLPRNVMWNHIVGLVLFHEYIGEDFAPVEKEYLAFCRRIATPSEIRVTKH